MKIYKYQTLLILALNLTSCQDELELSVLESNQTEAIVEKNIKNGRFIFSSKESLDKTIEKFQNQEVEKVEREFEKIYTKGFRSHKAIVNPNNEVLQAKFSKEIIQKRELHKSSSNSFSKEDAENEDVFIADPVFASLVNDNNEIIVNDTLYKITKDEGVFIVHVKDSLYLFDYLKNLKPANTNKLTSAFFACKTRFEEGGYSRINNRISKYIRPIKEYNNCGGSGGSFSGGSATSSGSILSEEVKLQNVISNLKKCRVKEPKIQSLFGNVFVCIEKFDSKHRVKTEFWDQSWGFYKSAGVLTKTQRRRFGIWWKSNADEIHLGINKILLKYNVPAPEILKHKQPSNIHSDFIRAQNPIFMYNNYYYTENLSFNSSYMGTSFNNIWYQTTLKIQKNKIPFFKFDDADILNIYIPLQKYSGKLKIKDVNVNITLGNTILTESNIKNLYKTGFNFLKSNGSTKKEFVVTYQVNEKEIEVLYFAQRYKKKNANIIKVRMFKDKNFLVSYSNSLNGNGGKFGVDFLPVANVGHRKYTHYEIDFYGLAKRDNKWRGSRVIEND